MKHNKKIGKRHAYWFYINSSRQNTSQDLIRPNTAHNTTPSTKSSVRPNATPSVRSNTKLKESDSNTSNGKTQRNHSTQNSTRSKSSTNRSKSNSNSNSKTKNSNKLKKNSNKRKKKTQGMTYSQKKRASFNYRNEYFKKNPGIYGNIWFCSQCGKILIGKHNVVIDHIVPLNSIAGVNRTFNTVAICQKCNSSKSDCIDYRIAKGYLAKLFEVLTSHLPDALALVLSLIVSIAYQILNLLFILFTMPFTLANGKFLTYTVVILIIFAFILSKL